MNRMDSRLQNADAVVFDIGNVLLRFDPEIVVRLLPDETRCPLTEAMFGSKHMWSAFDLGREPNEAIARRIAAEAGLEGAWEQVMHVLLHFPEVLHPLPLMGCLRELKAQGKRLFALTNYPEPSFTETCRRFPALTEYLDGALVSAREKVGKPDPAIFQLLMERFGLSPQNTLFVDDALPNVQTAASLGFRTWHYAGDDRL